MTRQHTQAQATSVPLILTPPNPEHIIAAGILASGVGRPGPESLSHIPARVCVVSPIREMSAALRAWLDDPHRPACWLVALDGMALDELSADRGEERTTILERLSKAGLVAFIGPDEHEADPIRRIFNHFDYADSRAVADLDRRWRDIARSGQHRAVAVRRGVQALMERRKGHEPLPMDWQRQIALACSLTRSQGRQVRAAWDIGGPAWEEIRAALDLGDADGQWNAIFLEALGWLDSKPEEWVWQHQIIGFSAASRRLRDEARKAASARAAGKPVLVLAHDRAEAARLAAVIAMVGAGGDGTAEPDAPFDVWWDGRSTPKGLLLVEPAHEAAAYARKGPTVLDVPPLDERSMDLPHIALAELWRLHRTASRPGAPRAGCDRPEDLAWLSDRDLPGGTAGLRTWLSTRLAADPGGAWTRGDPTLPRHPGLDGPTCLGTGLTLDTASAQVVRWAMGAHSEQSAALRRLGLGSNRPPRSLVASSGVPRRLLRREDGGWLDRWAVRKTD